MKIAPFRLLIASVVLLVFVIAAQSTETPNKEQLLAQADSLSTQFKTQEALTLLENFLPSARASADSNFLLNILVRKGSILSRIGQYRTSEPLLIESVALAEALADTLNLLEAIRWLGVTVENRDRIEAGLLYGRLLSLAEISGSSLYQGWALVGLAWQDYFSGNSVKSASRYRKAIAFFESAPVSQGLAWAWNGLGTAVSNLGKYSEALTCYQKAADIARANGNIFVESMAMNNRGTLVYSFGDPGVALSHFVRSVELQNKLGYFQGTIQPTLNIALCNIRLGRYDDAEIVLTNLQSECQKRNLTGLVGKVLIHLADIKIAKGHVQQAIALLHEVLDLGTNIPLYSRIQARIALSSYLQSLGNIQEAREVLTAGEKEIAGRGLFMDALALKNNIGEILLDQKLYRKALDHLLPVVRETKTRGMLNHLIHPLVNAAAAYRALDHPDSSLALLREAAEVWEAVRSVALDPEWRETRGKSGRLLYTDLAAQQLEPDATVPEQERIRTAFDQLQVFKARTLLERMLGPGVTDSVSVNSLKKLSLDHLQKHILRDGELLLDFYVGSNLSLVFAVTNSGCRVKTLPALEPLRTKITRYNGFVTQPPRVSETAAELDIIQKTGSQLFSLLFGDLEDMLLNNDLIFFSPDDVLNLLAPTTLLQDDKITSNWVRIPSATVLTRLREQGSNKQNNRTNRILALAGTHLPDRRTLPGTQLEIKMLAHQYQNVDLQIAPTTNTIASWAFSCVVAMLAAVNRSTLFELPSRMDEFQGY